MNRHAKLAAIRRAYSRWIPSARWVSESEAIAEDEERMNDAVSQILAMGVDKHLQGEHDQSSHGAWAQGAKNFDRADFAPIMGTQGERVAIYGQEALDAAEFYTGDGYKLLNEYLRSGDPTAVLESAISNADLPSSIALDYSRWESMEMGEDEDGNELTDEETQEIRDEILGEVEEQVDEVIDSLTDLIEKSGHDVSNGFLYRVASNRVLNKLTPGDVIREPGFMSTTIVDLTSPEADNQLTRLALGNISGSDDSVMRIFTDKYGSGAYVSEVGVQSEQEVLLPPNTELVYLGKDDNGVMNFRRTS